MINIHLHVSKCSSRRSVQKPMGIAEHVAIIRYFDAIEVVSTQGKKKNIMYKNCLSTTEKTEVTPLSV